MTLAETAPSAAAYLKEVVAGKTLADQLRQDACKYVLNQSIGAPSQRHNIALGNQPGEGLTLQFVPARADDKEG